MTPTMWPTAVAQAARCTGKYCASHGIAEILLTLLSSSFRCRPLAGRALAGIVVDADTASCACLSHRHPHSFCDDGTSRQLASVVVAASAVHPESSPSFPSCVLGSKSHSSMRVVSGAGERRPCRIWDVNSSSSRQRLTSTYSRHPVVTAIPAPSPSIQFTLSHRRPQTATPSLRSRSSNRLDVGGARVGGGRVALRM